MIFILVVFYSCRSEVNETLKGEVATEGYEVWPKDQDQEGSIESLYEAVSPELFAYSNQQFAAKRAGKWGVINEENQLYFPFEYDTIVANEKSIALRKGVKYEIFDASRTLIAELGSDELVGVMQGFYASSKNGKKALINPNGMMVLDHRFDDLSGPKDESYFLAKIAEEWEAYDMVGIALGDSTKGYLAAKWLNEYRVSLKDYGPLKLGMGQEDVEAKIGWELKKIHVGESCSVYSLGDDFLDIELMFNEEVGGSLTLERMYFREDAIRTKSGIGIGSERSAVMKAYTSKIQPEKNEFFDDAENLYYVPTDRRDRLYRLNFLSRKGRVVEASVGRLPSIKFSEACL